MGACATKSGDLKVKGEAPLVVEDGAAPPVAAGEETKADGVPAAAKTDPADVSGRRSLSDLLKEDAEASDREPDQEEETVVTEEESAAANDGAGEQKGSQAPVELDDKPAEELNGDPKDIQERCDDAQAQVVEQEKRVDPDSVQVAAAAAQGAEESKVGDGAPACDLWRHLANVSSSWS